MPASGRSLAARRSLTIGASRNRGKQRTTVIADLPQRAGKRPDFWPPLAGTAEALILEAAARPARDVPCVDAIAPVVTRLESCDAPEG